MAGQNGHFGHYAPEKIPYAIERYVKETNRLYGVLDRQLAGRDYIAGDYTIADMACYPWIVSHERHGQNLDDFPSLKRWFYRIRERPACQRAYVGVQQSYSRKISDEERKILFGQTATSHRS
jgi:GST-like protein